MIDTLIVLVVLLWLLGAFAVPVVIGPAVHLLLVVVLVLVIIRVLGLPNWPNWPIARRAIRK